MRKDTCSLAMQRHSHIISKMKPKIRIIHIFAPQIIKTDVHNFRELVQRLTGKPTVDEIENYEKKKKKPRTASTEREQSMKMEVRDNGVVGLDHHGSKPREKVKEEEGLENGEKLSWGGGYLGGFSDLEGFVSEIGQFPLLPWDQGFEEPLLS